MATPFDFTGRVVLVTGGGSGLGLAAATRFAEGGARVVINDLREDAARQAANELGPQHLGVGGDVASEQDVARMVDAAHALEGRLDVVVNNAGIPDAFKPTVDIEFSYWQRMLDIHLSGTFLVSQAAARHMIADGAPGAIINISSIGGVVGLPWRTSYSTAKAGISMMTRVLGCEWGAQGIRVNAVAPGYIETPMTRGLIDSGVIDTNRIRRRTPMGQWGKPGHIADAITFLASDQAAFITGVTLPVDGGYMAFGAPGDAFTIEED
jgi:NAD(P)-dependent dehydrogenase (short-subunit alcohol dehydrogenase family)